MHQLYYSLAIRLFSVITRTLSGGVFPLYIYAVGVFYSPSRLGQKLTGISELNASGTILSKITVSFIVNFSLSKYSNVLTPIVTETTIPYQIITKPTTKQIFKNVKV